MRLDNLLIGGRYRLIEQIGVGGTSVVWRGLDEARGRPAYFVERLAGRHPSDASGRWQDGIK